MRLTSGLNSEAKLPGARRGWSKGGWQGRVHTHGAVQHGMAWHGMKTAQADTCSTAPEPHPSPATRLTSIMAPGPSSASTRSSALPAAQVAGAECCQLRANAEGPVCSAGGRPLGMAMARPAGRDAEARAPHHAALLRLALPSPPSLQEWAALGRRPAARSPLRLTRSSTSEASSMAESRRAS